MGRLLKASNLIFLLSTFTVASCISTTHSNVTDSNTNGGDVAKSNNAELSILSISSGALSPAFSNDVMEYTSHVGISFSTIDLTAVPVVEGATITIENNSEAIADAANIDINLGTNAISITVTAPDGVTQKTYSIVADRKVVSQEAFIKASNAEKDTVAANNDSFGLVAIYGDTIVVGAGKEDSCAGAADTDNSCLNAGMAYVFTRSINGTWVQEAELKASNAVAGMMFAWQNADIYGNTIVIGADYESSNATGIINTAGHPTVAESNTLSASSGAVYVFIKDPDTGNWYQQAYIKASNAHAGDFFGYEVRLYEDTLAVSAPLEDSIATDSGALYIFERSNGVWEQTAFLKASNPSVNDQLGRWSLANHNGVIAIGSRYESSNIMSVHNVPGYPAIDDTDNNDSATNSGAIYVFTKTDGTWSQKAFLKGSNTEAGDTFSSVDIYDDTIVVGAYAEGADLQDADSKRIFNRSDYDHDFPSVADSNNNALASGAVYVFQRTPGTDEWTQQAYIKASNTHAGDNFGYTVRIYQDTLLVGARYESSSLTGVYYGTDFVANTSLSHSGALYVFTRDKNGKWEQSNYIKASNPKVDAGFTSAGTAGVDIYDGVIVASSSAESTNLQEIINENDYDEPIHPTITESNVLPLAPNSGAVYVFY